MMVLPKPPPPKEYTVKVHFRNAHGEDVTWEGSTFANSEDEARAHVLATAQGLSGDGAGAWIEACMRAPAIRPIKLTRLPSGA